MTTYRKYKLEQPGAPLFCTARTKGEARRLFKQRLGRQPGQRLRIKIRVVKGA